MKRIETLPGGWGGKRAMLVTDPNGQMWAYRQSGLDARMLERAPLVRRDDTPSFGEDAEFIEGFHEPDVYAALGFNSVGGDLGAAADPTTTAFTINGGTSEVTIFLNNTIDIKAIVTFVRGPATSGEPVQFWAQDTLGDPAFEFTTVDLGATAPYTAENAAYAVTAAAGFATGTTYNCWAVYPGDSKNGLSKSNVVQLKIQAS